MKKSNNEITLRQRLVNWVEGEDGRAESLPTITNLDTLDPADAPREHRSVWQMEDEARIPVEYWVMGILVSLTVMIILVITAIGMPPFDDPNAPTMNEVPRRYVEQGMEETGAVNTVAGMILDYRAFDTFGESTVLFSATASIVFLMRSEQKTSRKQRTVADTIPHFASPYTDKVFQGTARLLLPFIMLFGIYVVLNGHLSPGGGFSGGAVLGGGLILCSLVVGQNRMNQVLGPRRNTKMTACCLLAYAAMKSYSFYTGANHVGWEIPKGTPGNLLSAGFILPLNICVGIIVAGTIFSFYMLFTQEEEA